MYRRTTSYFQAKMELMHKTVTCEWIKNELISGGEFGAKNKTGPRIYYQYAKTNELKKKLAADTIISAFTIRMSNGGSVICVAHGHERKTGVTNVVKMMIQIDEMTEKLLAFTTYGWSPIATINWLR